MRIAPLASCFLAATIILSCLSAFSAVAQPFRVITEEFPPYNYTENGKLLGISTEIVREIQKRINRQGSIEVMPWVDGYRLAQEEKNIILFSTTRSPIREKLFKWVGPLVPNNLVFFAKKDSNLTLKTLDDARAVNKIGVYKDDFGELFLREKGFTNLAVVLENSRNVSKLLDNEIDLWIANELTGKHIIAKAGAIKDLRKIFEIHKNYMYLAFSLDTPDIEVAKWQKALDDLKADGSYAQIFSSWIMFSYTEDLHPQANNKVVLSPKEQAWIKEHPVIRVAADPDYEPFQYRDANGHTQGLANDYLALITKKLGIHFELTTAESWNLALESVKHRKQDMVIVATKTPEREAYMSFTSPYVAFPDMIVTRKNNPKIDSIVQLHGKKLATLKGFAINNYIRTYYPQVKLVFQPDTVSALESVSMGEVDATVMNVATVSSAIEKANITNLRVDGDTGFTYELSFASRKDWPVLNTLLQKGLSAITAKERKNLLRKWISIAYDDTAKSRTEERIVPLTTEEKVWLEKNPVITVAPDPQWAPVEFFDNRSRYSGISADYIALMEKRLGIKFHVLRLNSWEEIIQKAVAGKIDILPCVARTPKRDENLLFTAPYLTLPSVIIVNDKEPGQLTMNDLKGKVVAVVAGYAVQEYLESGYPEIHLVQVENAEEGLRQVSYGTAYAFIDSIATTSYIIERDLLVNLRVAGESGYVWQLAFATHKKSPILNRILAKGLASISKEERQGILSKWILIRKESWQPSKEQVIGLIIIIAGLFVIGIIVWNRILVKKVEQRTRQLYDAKALAEAASRTKGEFLAAMSHELRTPLTTVIGASQLLEGADLAPHNLRMLREIRNAGEYLSTLIDDVLDLSHIEQGRVEIVQQYFLLKPLLVETVDMLRPVANKKKIELKLECGLLPVSLQGDPVRIRQIITNLVANAAKYAQQGHVKVQVEAVEASHLLILVEDDGPGIAADKLETIFQPFERAEAGGDHTRGIGLGLTICKRLVEAMGGTIGVESTLGKGSLFWLTIPYEADAAIVELPSGDTGIPGPYDILLAEDTEANRDILTLLLENDGHLITAVENGEVALEEASNYRFDLILMDVRMPIMDGLEATRCIRALDDSHIAKTPIYALTAQVTREIIDTCRDVGMNGVIAKPLRLGNLYATIAGDADVKKNEPAKPPLFDQSLRVEYSKRLSPEQLAELTERQLRSLAQEQARLYQAWEGSDFQELTAAAHKLAGTAGMAGFMALADVALRLELAGQKNNREAISDLMQEYREIKAQTAAAC